MSRGNKPTAARGVAVALALGGLGAAAWTAPALAADVESIDWSAVPTKTVQLFYPGQSSYEWLRSPEHKKAQRETMQGESCIGCHEGEEQDLGDTLVKAGRLEPTPIEGQKGVIDLNVQAAHDDTYLYFRFNWKTNLNREGRLHDLMRFDGSEWKFWGGHRAEEKVRSGEEPPIYEDRLAIMIDDGSVPMFAEQGCWLTCHDGMRHMPNRPSRDEVQAHPYLGELLKQHDIRKFLPASRTDESGWGALKSPDEIAEIKTNGGFVDLMQWRVARSNPVGMADDGYVLEYRLFDAGKKPFSWNVDRKTMTPKFMFDEAKVGFKALREEDLEDPAKPTAVIREENAVEYSPDAGWQEGDILPGRLLTRTGTEGSAGDNDYAKGVWADSQYTLVFRRKLDTGHPEDDKILKVGDVYTMGLAVHDDNVTTRFHHVSFPQTLGIGVAADIEAVTLQ